jgi:hypothetical protein
VGGVPDDANGVPIERGLCRVVVVHHDGLSIDDGGERCHRIAKVSRASKQSKRFHSCHPLCSCHSCHSCWFAFSYNARVGPRLHTEHISIVPDSIADTIAESRDERETRLVEETVGLRVMYWWNLGSL